MWLYCRRDEPFPVKVHTIDSYHRIPCIVAHLPVGLVCRWKWHHSHSHAISGLSDLPVATIYLTCILLALCGYWKLEGLGAND